MAQIQRTIFFLCIASVYAASISNISEEDFSAEMKSLPNESNAQKNLSEITEYDPMSPSLILTEENGFEMGKSLVPALLGMFQILRQLDLSQEGLKSVSNLVARMVSMFAGQYYETMKKFMPVFSGMAIAFLESSPCTKINECRKYLFTRKDRQLENIPPTEDALYQHTLRAVYQGVHVWGQALVCDQNLPSPSAWGWKQDAGQWIPHWSDKPAVASICLELTRCKCKAGCKTRCNCMKRHLKCTQFCLCGGNCDESRDA